MKNLFRATILCFTLLLAVSGLFAQDSIPFIVFGDWGSKGHYVQPEVAYQMSEWAQNNNATFIISAGDNFYDRGVVSTSDEQWQTSFENIYTAKSLQIPWYAALGNHDYWGIVQAEIDYSKNSSRWKMPSRYFDFTYSLSGGTKALFVIIDTSPLVLSDPESYSFYEDVHSFNNNIQLRWLDSVLANSNAKWKFVIGHHPVYSGGYHGGAPEMQEQVKPILEKHNVNIYFCGHDHDMQHLRDKDSKLNYFVSGAGSHPRNCDNTKYTLFYKGKTGGFLGAILYSDKIRIVFIDDAGDELYRTTVTSE